MRRILPLLALASLAFAPAPFLKDGRLAPDLKRAQGKWAVESVRIDGDPALSPPDEVVIEGDTMAYLQGGELQSVWRVSLDATSSPRKCDLRGLGGRARNATVGTWKLDGDTLTLRYRFVLEGHGLDRAEWVEALRRKKP